MTTPQSHLYMLSNSINHLTDLFESDQEGNNIFDTIREIELKMKDLINAQEKNEELMRLIIKLLSQNEKL
jgi:hypothetical protein